MNLVSVYRSSCTKIYTNFYVHVYEHKNARVDSLWGFLRPLDPSKSTLRQDMYWAKSSYPMQRPGCGVIAFSCPSYADTIQMCSKRLTFQKKVVDMCTRCVDGRTSGKTGISADRDKIDFELFNAGSN